MIGPYRSRCGARVPLKEPSVTDTLPPLLEGVRILDLSAVISGPLATGLMADQGAEVWKVENLAGGDMTRALGAQHRGLTAMFATVNRNKKSIALDLRIPGDGRLYWLWRPSAMFLSRTSALGRQPAWASTMRPSRRCGRR